VRTSPLWVAPLALSAATACGNGKNLPLKPTSVSCPGSSSGGLTVCDLKLDSSTSHPQAGIDIELDSVVVTTPTMAISRSGDRVTSAGFFVQDRSSSDTFRGAYSGVLVTYDPSLPASALPVLFETIQLQGTYEVSSAAMGQDPERRVHAKQIKKSGQKYTIQPVSIERADLVATGGEKAAAYEAVLIRLREVSVSDTKVMIDNLQIPGAFRVNQTLIVSSSLYDYSKAQLDEQFSSVSGVLRLGVQGAEAGQSLLTPRFATDIVGKNASSIVTSIVDAQDPNSPGHPLEGCQNLTGSQAIGKCATVRFSNVVVTAVDGYISRNLRAVWVQDDTVPDGQFAGVMLTYNPNQAAFIPKRGDRIDVEGELIEYKRGLQVQNTTMKPTATLGAQSPTDIAPIDVSADDVARTNAPETNPYEGVLVRVTMPTITTACLEDSKGRDHGDFVVDDEVYVGGTFTFSFHGGVRPASIPCLTPEGEPTGLCGCDSHSLPGDRRMIGKTLQSITGIPQFTFDDFQLEPRGDGDVVE
jgi:hypothetical protein